MAPLARLRSVDGAELRFRLAVEWRKHRDRVRSALRAERWHRDDLAVSAGAGAPLRSALAQRDWHGAHRAIVGRIADRPPRFPLDPRQLPQRRELVAASFPAARAEAAARASRMLEGRYDLLGYQDLPFGTPPAWHLDPVHGRRPPAGFWARVPYLDPRYGDHKIIWEINRHQHWLGLARAWQLTGDRRYYHAFVGQLENWMAANPPLEGVNWASMLELAFRALSWIWALHFFAAAALDDPADASPWSVDLLLGLDRQLTHVEHNLSRYFSPNTHLSGEALGLYVAGAALPDLATSPRRQALGRAVLLEEIDRQINADGGHAELSGHYHRYSTDFYLLATVVARLVDDPAAARFEAAARRQAHYLRVIADGSGRVPLLGDDDGGVLFPICGRPPWDCRDTLASAAVILDDPALAVGATPEETLWLCGQELPGRPASPPTSTALPASGYYVSRTASGDHLIFDAGRHGFLNGGHAHADALAIVLTAAGRPLLVDAGTATYTMDPALRNRFRSTAMHNTVMVGGRSQSEPRGPFHWASRTDAVALGWQSEPRFDYAEGLHDGYRPVAHVRAVFALHGIGWVVLDHLLDPASAAVEADILWHLDPSWRQHREAGTVFVHLDGTYAAIGSSAALRVLSPAEAAGLDSHAPVYGAVGRGLCVRSRIAAAPPFTVATFVALTDTPAAPALLPVPIDRPPGPGWHAAAFRLTSGRHESLILSVVECQPDAESGGTPDTPWGAGSELITGRAAVVPLDGQNSLFLATGSHRRLGGVRRA